MQCWSVLKNGESEAVTLNAVCDGSEENKTFAKYTPCASVNMTIDNPTAQGQFQKGKEYYVDFTPA